MKRNPLFTIILLICFSCFSCKKFIQVPNAVNQLTNDAVFADSINASAAVLATYINMMSSSNAFNFVHGGITVYTSLSADELISNRTASFGEEKQFYMNALPVANLTTASLWSSGYNWIFQINTNIEGVSASNGMSAACKNQLIGESKFMRAFLYFNLVNLYGDVPLVTGTDYRINASLPRSNASLVYQQIITDLTEAQQLLSATYPSAGKARPNRYAAVALLARVYLYLKQWGNAETASSSLISSGLYSLSPLNSVFLANSSEAILQLIPLQSGAETAEGKAFITTNTTTVPPFNVSSYLLNAFETGDQRQSSWLAKNTVVTAGVTNTYYYPFKYQFANDGLATPKNYYMLLREGEQYLIRAEARAQQNNISGALGDLNMVRNRAGLQNSAASTQPGVLNAIYHERQLELFCEMGHRWYDLKRTGQADLVMPAVTTAKGGTWTTNAQLFPIPYVQIQANPFLSQNPGY